MAQNQSPVRSNDRRPASVAPRRGRAVALGTWITIAVTSAVLIAGLSTAVRDRLPLSNIDEIQHLDHALKIHDGDLPFRGSIYSRGVIREWSCGVGSEAGPSPFPCGSSADIPSTAYIHYPTFFVGAEVWRRALQGLVHGDSRALTVYRFFSVFCVLAGVVVGIVVSGAVFRFRGAKLVAAAFVPVASSVVLYLGTKLNPSSTATLTGVLIAAAGIRWVSTGRGFGLLLAASLAASVTLATDSLPAAAFVLLVALALLARRHGWRIAGPWKPRWSHLGALTATLVVPIIVWGAVTSARATLDNQELYGQSPHSLSETIVGSFRDLALLHTPWYDSDSVPSGTSTLFRSLRTLAGGFELWIAVLVIGALTLVALRLIRVNDRSPSLAAPAELVTDQTNEILPPNTATEENGAETTSSDSVRSHTLCPTYLLAACTVAVLVLYPLALFLSNALGVGDPQPAAYLAGVTSRYSVSLMPLLTYLVLLLVPGRTLPRVLAVMGTVTVIGLSVSWF